VVIVLHPLSGRRDATAFHLEAGRLCVLASRHRHACIMVARAGIPELLEGWLTEPNVRSTVPGVHHHDVALGFLRSAGTANNLTTDAQLAAIAVENDATVYSNDSDFARFDGVKWINPLAPR
jgi:predicted nucleic acid-binding protein